ncbi:MAG: diacylglycerol kinase [Pseudobdellovibrio sp.]
MKKMSFFNRFKFALLGLKTAWLNESSFRFQVICACGALATLFFLKAKLIWWAIFIIIIGSILAAELINTALENTLDALHPAQHPLIGKAKDCAAAAVLMLCFCSVLIFIVFIIDSCFY